MVGLKNSVNPRINRQDMRTDNTMAVLLTGGYNGINISNKYVENFENIITRASNNDILT